MVVKSTDRFYLTFEVDLVNMTVILIKDGEESKIYDANQYFQYFSEYGVRKADEIQLQEHFSMEAFQNLMVNGKDSEDFEFCVSFAGEEYKILQCKMKPLEKENQSIIKIVLEDISHKRVEQLNCIKNNIIQDRHKLVVKPFNIKFEYEKETKSEKGKLYICMMIVVGIICIALSVIFIRELYLHSIEKDTRETLNSCKNMSNCIEQQINCTFRNLIVFKEMISSGNIEFTEQQLIKHIEEDRIRYGYTGMAFVAENNSVLYTNDRLKYGNTEQIANNFEYKNKDKLAMVSDFLNGSIQLNYVVPIEELYIENKPYKLMVVMFDLNKLCNIVIDTGNTSTHDMIIINKEGDVLWGNSSQMSYTMGGYNFFEYVNNKKDTTKKDDNRDKMYENLQGKQAGVTSFNINGEKRFVAYAPLNIEDLYVVSLSKEMGLREEGVKLLLLALSILLSLIMFLVIHWIYHMKKTMREKLYLEKVAYSDVTTNGKNMNFFDEKAKPIIRKMECHYALIITNFSGNSTYNGKYISIRGDKMIKRIFMAISQVIDDEELVSRYYSEHMLILMKYEGDNQLEERLEDIAKSIADTKFKLEFGVCIIRDLTMDLEVAKERANRALENAVCKQLSNGTVYYYDMNLLEKIIFEKELENTMYGAFRKGEFKIFVEPRYDLNTRAICNGDAYAVWEHPTKGKLEPEAYIGVLERKGLLMCLDSFMFEEICKSVKKHIEEGHSCLPITVKLHRNQFNGKDFINKFLSIKDKYNIPGEYLDFEISEETVFKKLNQISNILDCIHKMGGKCILNNYKGEFLPISQLYKLEIDGIEFPLELFNEQMPTKIVSGVINIIKAMDGTTIVTGVSSQEQIGVLMAAGCEQAKGDVFAKNISLDDYINIF